MSPEELEALEEADWQVAAKQMRDAEARWEDAGCPTGFGWEYQL